MRISFQNEAEIEDFSDTQNPNNSAVKIGTRRHVKNEFLQAEEK